MRYKIFLIFSLLLLLVSCSEKEMKNSTPQTELKWNIGIEEPSKSSFWPISWQVGPINYDEKEIVHKNTPETIESQNKPLQ